MSTATREPCRRATQFANGHQMTSRWETVSKAATPAASPTTHHPPLEWLHIVSWPRGRHCGCTSLSRCTRSCRTPSRAWQSCTRHPNWGYRKPNHVQLKTRPNAAQCIGSHISVAVESQQREGEKGCEAVAGGWGALVDHVLALERAVPVRDDLPDEGVVLLHRKPHILYFMRHCKQQIQYRVNVAHGNWCGGGDVGPR